MGNWHKIYEHSGKVSDYLTDSLGEQVEECSLPENDLERRVATRLLNRDYLRKKLDEQKMFDAEAAFERLHKRKIRRNIRKYGSIAAMLAIMLGGWLLSGVQEDTDKVTMATNTGIAPGSHKAMLTLPGGEVVLLKDSVYAPIRTEVGLLQVDSAQVFCNIDSVGQRAGKVEFSKIFIPRGGEYRLTLADGSQVWLNSDTELRFPLQFGSDAREVYLKGEAYFDVRTNSERPFIVHTDLGDVKVLGTAFNVSAYYPDRIAATLERGSISYVGQRGDEFAISPGEQLTYASGDLKPEVRKVNTRLYTIWKEHLFSFEEQHLDEIMETLARWYDFQVFFESEDLKKIEFSGTLDKYSDIAPLLELFELSGKIKFDVNGKTIIVKR